MTVLLALDGDERTVRHLTRALDSHRSWCRANAVPFPASLAELATFLASIGQDGTDGDGGDPFADTAPMYIAMTFEEAADALRVSPRSVRRLVDAGDLHAISIAGRRRIHRDDLADYATKLRQDAGALSTAAGSSGPAAVEPSLTMTTTTKGP